jgi:hypothetical protein
MRLGLCRDRHWLIVERSAAPVQCVVEQAEARRVYEGEMRAPILHKSVQVSRR